MLGKYALLLSDTQAKSPVLLLFVSKVGGMKIKHLLMMECACVCMHVQEHEREAKTDRQTDRHNLGRGNVCFCCFFFFYTDPDWLQIIDVAKRNLELPIH